MIFFSERLKSLRGDKTRAAFARFLGIPPAMYHRYERGQVPKDRNLKVIADHCGVTVDWLLGRTDAREYPAAPCDVDRSVVQEHPAHRFGTATYGVALDLTGIPDDELRSAAKANFDRLIEAKQGRELLDAVGRVLVYLHEIQERCIDRWSGKKRGPDGRRA